MPDTSDTVAARILDDEDTRGGRAILRDLARSVDLVDETLEPLGLSLRRFAALNAIAEAEDAGEPLSMREMGRESASDHAYMVRILTSAGLVARVLDGADRRRVRLATTDEGRRALATAGRLATDLLVPGR